MSYATLLVWVNVDHVSKQLVSIAAGVADKFAAKLIGLSALAILLPFVAEGVVIVDNASELDIAKGVLDAYEKKAGIGQDDTDRARLAGLKRGLMQRGLYEVASLAWMLQDLGWLKDAAAWEAEIEQDNSPIPAQLGEALQALGRVLVDMTAEEVAELLGSADVDVVPDAADPDEAEIVTNAANPKLARFRLGLHRARKAAQRHGTAPVRRDMRTHRRMAALFSRELTAG